MGLGVRVVLFVCVWEIRSEPGETTRVYWRPVVEDEFWILEYSFPVSNTPLHMGSEVTLPHSENKRTKTSVGGRVSKPLAQVSRSSEGRSFEEGKSTEVGG